MPRAVISDIAEDPAQICLLCTRAQVSRTHAAFHLGNQSRLLCWHRLGPGSVSLRKTSTCDPRRQSTSPNHCQHIDMPHRTLLSAGLCPPSTRALTAPAHKSEAPRGGIETADPLECPQCAVPMRMVA